MIIRINLHPNRKPKSKGTAARNAAIVTALLCIAIIAIALSGASICDKKSEKVNLENANVLSQIKSVKSRMSDLSTIKSKIQALEAREEMLRELTGVRRGPQFVLNEFGRLLSNPRDVMARKDASENGWLLAWEPDNVMIKSFKDLGNSTIQIDGEARMMDDVYEFWTRMKTSKLLRNVELVEIKGNRGTTAGEQTHSFSFKMAANFNYQTKEGRALLESLDSEDMGDSVEESSNGQNAAQAAQKRP